MRRGDTGGRYFLLLVRSEVAQGAQKEGRYKSAEAAKAPFRRVEHRTARRGAEHNLSDGGAMRGESAGDPRRFYRGKESRAEFEAIKVDRETSHLRAGKSPENIEKQEKSRNLNDCGICKIWSG